MKFLLFAFSLLALTLSLSGLCVAQSEPFMNQNTTTTNTRGCTVNVTNSRIYIRKINTITRVALDSFGRNKTIFLPLTTPLIVGLTQNPIFTRAGPNMTALSSIITANGKAMKQLAGTLEGIVDDWANSEATYQTTYSHPNASERRQFIDSINNITRTQLHQLGRNNTRLERITNPLSATLLFSPVTSLGSTLFNVNQNISKSGSNLKGLAYTLEEMARKWALTTDQFIDQEAAFCQPSAVPVLPESESVSRAVPALNNNTSQSEQFDQQCLASRPTNRSYITSLNEKTQQTLTAFGRTNLRLQSLSTALWLGLRFSTLTQKGYTAYNYNQNISITGTELKAFAQSILQVTEEWEAAEAQFARDSNRDCRVPSATVTTTDPLINPRVMINTEIAVTAAPVEVATTEDVVSVLPALVVTTSSAESLAPSTATTVSPVSQASTSSPVAAVTSVIRETPTSTAAPEKAFAVPEQVSAVVSQVSPLSTTAAPAATVIVEASTSTAVPQTATAAVTVSPVSQASTLSPATAGTSTIVKALTSTAVPETATPEESSVAPEATEVATESLDTTVNPGKDQPLHENFIN